MRGKSLILIELGKHPLTEGCNILGAHVDSPRLDIKQNPLEEKNDLAYLDTHYYGGIKKYQWVALPLALHGVVVKPSGEVVEICIGEDERRRRLQRGLGNQRPRQAEDPLATLGELRHGRGGLPLRRD